MTEDVLRLLLEIRKAIESDWQPGSVGWQAIATRIDALLARPPGYGLDPLDLARKAWEKANRSDPLKAMQLMRAEIESRPQFVGQAIEKAAKDWLRQIGVPDPTTNFAGSFTADSGS